MIILKYMNLVALFSKLYYVTWIHIILDLLFYNYLKFYKFTNLQILIKSFHINTINFFTNILHTIKIRIRITILQFHI